MLRHLLPIALVVVLFAPPARSADGTFDSNGVKIHYRDQGSGEPVVLVHGFTANIPIQWDFPGITRALARDYRVIAFDARGHGRSGKPYDPKQYGSEMARDVVRLLDHLKVPKAHVVGYSMGALITCKLLTLAPDRLLSATLGGAGGIRSADDLGFIDTLAESLDQGKGIAPLLIGLTPPGRRKPTEAELNNMTLLLRLTNDTRALAAVVRGWKDLVVADEALKANRLPVLSLVGEEDPLKKTIEGLEGKLAGMRVVVLPGCDHMDAFAQPEFVAELRKFLARGKVPAGR